jgi:hypothetical protein
MLNFFSLEKIWEWVAQLLDNAMNPPMSSLTLSLITSLTSIYEKLQAVDMVTVTLHCIFHHHSSQTISLYIIVSVVILLKLYEITHIHSRFFADNSSENSPKSL